jgi:hypothetical protein
MAFVGDLVDQGRISRQDIGQENVGFKTADRYKEVKVMAHQ